MCDDKRQEFILLSDTLGVSMLVDAINHRTPEGATETTVLGPFYVQRAPEHPLGADISGTMEGAPLLVTGTVSTAGGKPLAGAVVDVWHSDDDGYYDVQQLDEIGELAMRARFRTDENGRFWFWSIKPAAYPIPHDGPVGKMLEAQGRHPWRPAHVHFMISAPGHQTLVTHVFAAGDQYLDSDVVFGVKDSLIREFAGMPAGTAARWPRDGAALLSSELRFRTEGGIRKRAAPESAPPSAYAATASAARSSTSAIASRSTSTPAPGLTPFSARWRRKARAPGTP